MFTIRKATLEDIPLINKLAWEAFPATYKDILTPEQIVYMMDWMYSPENLRKQMTEEGHIYYIAFRENEGAGYVSIQPEGEGLFHLQKIYVLPQYQKHHLGKLLFGQAAPRTVPHGTERKPREPGIRLLPAHGHGKSARRRHTHRKRLLHERLHHGAQYLTVISRQMGR